MDIRETNSDYQMEKNVLRQLLFLEIVSVTKVKNKLFGCINELLRKSGGGGRLVKGGVFKPFKELDINNRSCPASN